MSLILYKLFGLYCTFRKLLILRFSQIRVLILAFSVIIFCGFVLLPGKNWSQPKGLYSRRYNSIYWCSFVLPCGSYEAKPRLFTTMFARINTSCRFGQKTQCDSHIVVFCNPFFELELQERF